MFSENDKIEPDDIELYLIREYPHIRSGDFAPIEECALGYILRPSANCRVYGLGCWLIVKTTGLMYQLSCENLDLVESFAEPQMTWRVFNGLYLQSRQPNPPISLLQYV